MTFSPEFDLNGISNLHPSGASEVLHSSDLFELPLDGLEFVFNTDLISKDDIFNPSFDLCEGDHEMKSSSLSCSGY